jgi:hypothetical protein
MKQLLKSKLLIGTTLVLLTSATVVTATVGNPKPTSATEVTPLVTEVNQHAAQLDNHEARIGNAENNIKDLQAKTNTAPSVSNQAVPAPVSTPTATSAPTPITVASFTQIPLDNTGNIDCSYIYSDGTTYQWHWQTVTPQGTWVTDGVGQNGHWVASTQTNNNCSKVVIGTVKTN